MAKKQVINNDVINIDGEFDSVGEMIKAGRLEEAEKALRGVDLGRQDLSSSALLADVRAGESEMRQGMRPTNQLSRSGMFGGEKASPLQLQAGAEQADRLDKRLRLTASQYRTSVKLSRQKIKQDILRAISLDKKSADKESMINTRFILKMLSDRLNSGLATEKETEYLAPMLQQGIEKLR